MTQPKPTAVSKNESQPTILSDSALEAVQGGFFRPAPSGDGTTEQFFTVEISEGRLQPKTPGGFSGG